MNEEGSFLVTLYETIQRLAQQADTSVASSVLLNNSKSLFLEPKDSTEATATASAAVSLTPEQAFVCALTFATHVLHRLVTAVAESNNNSNSSDAVLCQRRVLAGWARLVLQHVHALLPAHSKWDKATGSTRHLLARLVTTVTGACLTSLTHNDGVHDEDTDTLLVATMTLEEAMLNLTTRPPVFGHSNEVATETEVEEEQRELDLERFPLTENTTKIAQAYMKTSHTIHHHVTATTSSSKNAKPNAFWTAFEEANAVVDSCEWTDTEWTLLKCLASPEAVDKTSTATANTANSKTAASSGAKASKKRGRRHVEETPVGSSPWRDAWENFCKENKMSQIPLDGRLTARRWASVMMDWYLQAGSRLLVKAQTLLSSGTALMDLTLRLDDDDEWIVPGQVLPVLLVGRWARILAESVSRSGHRPPSMGGFDAYVKPFVPVGLRVKGKGAKKIVRPDSRDITMVTIHSLLEAHAECIDASDVHGGLPYCLWVPDIIRDLAMAAGGGLSGTESHECVERLEHAAAAYIPTIFANTLQHRDWILHNFGLTKLQELLNMVSADDENGIPIPTHFESDWVEAYGDLPTPSTLLSKPASKKKKTEAAKSGSDYAGVYPKSLPSLDRWERLALHFRGYGTPKKAKQSSGQTKTSGQGVIANALTYWFTIAEEALIGVRSNKKDKSRTTTTSRPSKRRRKDTVEEPANDEGNPKEESDNDSKKINKR